jgi:hypothetical protein
MLSRDPRQQHSGILNVTDLFLLVFPVSGVEDTMKTSQIPVFPARKSAIFFFLIIY